LYNYFQQTSPHFTTNTESVIRFSRLQIYAYRLSDRSWRDEFRIYWWCKILNSETEPTVVGVVEGSPSSTESSLIETSITVPAVNAAFYACAPRTIVSRCHRPLLFSKRIHSNYELGRFLLVSTDLISRRISGVWNLWCPIHTPAISFHYFLLKFFYMP